MRFYPRGFPSRLRPAVDIAILDTQHEFPKQGFSEERIRKGILAFAEIGCKAAEDGEWRIDLAHSGIADFISLLSRHDSEANAYQYFASDEDRITRRITTSEEWKPFLERLAKIASAKPKAAVVAHDQPPVVRAPESTAPATIQPPTAPVSPVARETKPLRLGEYSETLKNLQALGLTVLTDELAAGRIVARLHDIYGDLMEGKFSFQRSTWGAGQVPDIGEWKFYSKAYAAVAREIVTKDTPDEVLEKTIPIFLVNYRLQKKWNMMTTSLDGVKGSIIGQISKWKSKVMKKRLAAVEATQVNDAKVKAVEPNNSVAERRRGVVMPILEDQEMSRSQWAAKAGVDPSMVYDYLEGRSTPRAHNRRAMAEAIGLTLQQLPK